MKMSMKRELKRPCHCYILTIGDTGAHTVQQACIGLVNIAASWSNLRPVNNSLV